MKRIFILGIIILAAALNSSAQGTAKRSYVVSKPESISTLKIDGNINATLIVAPNEPNVFVDGSDNFSKNVETSFDNGVMTITARTSSRTENDVVMIYAPSLSVIELNGDVDLKTIGTINAEKLALSINGTCRLMVQHTGKLNVYVDDNYELVDETVTRLKRK